MWRVMLNRFACLNLEKCVEYDFPYDLEMDPVYFAYLNQSV